MKIVYFNYLYDLYGISIGSTIKAQELMRALENCGHEVKVYWRKRQPSQDNKYLEKSKVVLKKKLSKYLHDPKQFFSNVKYFFEEYKIISREKPDLIITRLDIYLFSGVLISKIKGIPCMVEADGPCVYEAREFHKEFWGIPGLAEKIEKYNLMKSGLNICVSNQAKDHFLEYGIPENKMHVINNGADIHKFSHNNNGEGSRQKFGFDNQLVIGFVGSFHYWHGVDNLIYLIKKIISADDNIVFLLVGSGGPMKLELDKFISKENLENRVILTGHITYDEIPNYIASMDIVLAPYPYLSFFYYSPVKIFEYMACGKPVISTRIGQIAEIIEDNVNGFLCEPDNSEEMYQKVHKLIKNEELRRRIGTNARNTIVKHHTWEKKAQQLSDLCISLVNGESGKE